MAEWSSLAYTALVIHIALLTTKASSLLADELMLAGFKVTEALWADEVLQLLETEHIDVVVITHDFGNQDPKLPEVQRRLMTIRLDAQATAKDVVWELSTLFSQNGLVQ